MKRNHTTPASWRRHFDAQRSSGNSVAAYLREKGIRSSQWYYWQKRLRDDCAASVSLVPVRVSPQPTPAQDCRIHLPNGIVLECVGVLSAVDLADQLMQLGQG